MIKHKSPISGISASENYIATAGYDNQVILWDRSGNSVGRIFHDHLANHCQIDPSEKYLVSSSSDFTARLYSLPDLKLLAVFGDHKDDVEMSAFNPKKNMVATASRDSNVRVFDFDGNLIYKFSEHQADVISVSWSDCGNILYSSSDDGTFRKWSLSEKRELSCTDFQGVETDTLVHLYDETVILGNDEGQIIVVVEGFKKEIIQAHSAGIKRIVKNRRNNSFVSLSYNRQAKLWNFLDGKVIQMAQFDLPADIWPRSADFISDEQIIFGTFGSSFATLNTMNGKWDLSLVEKTWGLNSVSSFQGNIYAIGDAGVLLKITADAKLEKKIKGPRNYEKVSEVGSLCNFLTPGKNFLVTGGQLGILFDALTGQCLFQHRSPLNCAVSFTYNEIKYFAVGSYTGEVLLFEEQASSIIYVGAFVIFKNAIKGLTSDGKKLFSVCATGESCFIDLHDLVSFDSTNLVVGKTHFKISNGCTSTDSGEFFSVSRDLNLRKWHGNQMKIIETPHSHSIKCITISKDQEHLALGAYDGTVSVFSLSKNKFIKTVRPTAAGISSITSLKDAFVCSSYDGCVYGIEI